MNKLLVDENKVLEYDSQEPIVFEENRFIDFVVETPLVISGHDISEYTVQAVLNIKSIEDRFTRTIIKNLTRNESVQSKYVSNPFRVTADEIKGPGIITFNIQWLKDDEVGTSTPETVYVYDMITGRPKDVAHRLIDRTKVMIDGNLQNVGNSVNVRSTGNYDPENNPLATRDYATMPYASLERLASYLYKISFDRIPEDTGLNIPTYGRCSSYVENGKLYRNLDWQYSEIASFLVECKGFKGMAFIDGLNDGNLDKRILSQLPYHIVDGINENGIMVSSHVLYNDWNWHGVGNKNISLIKLPYLILTVLKNLDNIESDLEDILGNIGINSESEYLAQFIVSDGETTYALMPPESSEGSYVIEDITEVPKISNFRWVCRDEVSRSDGDLQNRPTGIERFNMMPESLDELRFTKAYETPDRLSEFIGAMGTTKESTDEELEAIYELAHAAYQDRTRTGTTWQTVHSVVYSFKGIEHLYVQENWDRDYASGPGGEGGKEYGAGYGMILDSNNNFSINETIVGKKAEIDALGAAIDAHGASIRELQEDTAELSTDLASESSERSSADAELDGRLQQVESDIDSIEGLIPAAASSSNQLADKDFTNSSIATNTAYFKGTYESEEELPTEDVTNNDYAFVDTTDSEGNRIFKRYKYNKAEEEWLYEFTLNNSSFTAAQWATINSGLTREQLTTILGAISQLQEYVSALQTGKQDKIDSDHKLSANLIEENSSKRMVSDQEKQTWNGKADVEDIPSKLSDLADDINTVRTDAGSTIGFKLGCDEDGFYIEVEDEEEEEE